MEEYWRTVLYNLAFIGILTLIFANAYDIATQKVLAASTIVYLAILNTYNALSRQIGHGSIGILEVVVKLHRKTRPTHGDAELDECEQVLKTTVEKLHTNDIKLMIHTTFNVCVLVAMLLILMG